MRIYVPATLDELDAVSHSTAAARWTVAPRRAHAVTKELEAALPDEDAEGLEYVAALNAADDSLALIAGRTDAPHQRVIITVEVPDASVGPVVPGGADDDEPVASEVQVTSTVEQVAIVCVHVDEPEAAADIADVLAAADEESDAETTAEVGEESDSALDEALQRVTDRDLLWYDWSEIKDVPRG
ncbi:DUF6912 family protein [Promicromonospora sp. NPDC059942]|uniref:DUF6912 family protein n=1 Tax=Promicromonospora sp. NPDC059942 TaxID=3347009 RepID=UPI0036606D0B